MVFVKKQYIFDQILNGLKYVTVLANDAKTEIHRWQSDESTPEEVMNELEDLLDIQIDSGSTVFIKLSNASNKTKGKGGEWIQREFRVKTGNAGKSITGIGSAPSEFSDSLKSLYEKNLQLHVENERLRNEMKQQQLEIRMQAQIDKLKEESPMDKYLAPIMGMFMQGGNPQAAQMAAIHGTEENKVNDKERLQTILKRLRAIDANYIETLELITQFAEKDSQKYFGFIPMIKTML